MVTFLQGSEEAVDFRLALAGHALVSPLALAAHTLVAPAVAAAVFGSYLFSTFLDSASLTACFLPTLSLLF